MNFNTKTRLDNLRKEMSTRPFDTFMVLIGENRRYLSGYTGDDGQFDETAGILLITETEAVLLTDSRYDLQARQEAPLYRVVRYQQSFFKELPGILKSLGTRTLGFESVRLSYAQYQKMAENLEKADAGIDLIPVEELVESFRIQKDEEEVSIIRQALHVSETVFYDFIPTVKAGMTEKALAWRLEMHLKEAGAEALSFPTIVASGPNSAMPHAIPTDRPVQIGEPILFDFGIRLNGYCSDMTRMAVIGKPDDMYSNIYQVVLAAQQNASNAIKAGGNTKDIDAIARELIHAQGFEGKFGHGLGHGVGLAIHELPRLSPLSESPLKSQSVVTVEPGIYIHDWGGIRLENMVVVREDNAEILNLTDPADMIVIPL